VESRLLKKKTMREAEHRLLQQRTGAIPNNQIATGIRQVMEFRLQRETTQASPPKCLTVWTAPLQMQGMVQGRIRTETPDLRRLAKIPRRLAKTLLRGAEPIQEMAQLILEEHLLMALHQRRIRVDQVPAQGAIQTQELGASLARGLVANQVLQTNRLLDTKTYLRHR
jgi:hypothetical protein